MKRTESKGLDPDQTAPLSGSRPDETIEADGPLLSADDGMDGHAYARSFIGRKLGEYEVIREIGHGSMGIVFEARNDRLERTVALKVLPPSLSVTSTVIKRFLREAQSVAKLNHENIVQIYNIGDQDGVYFYAMQFIEGTPLDKVLKERRLSARESAAIVAHACRALFFAHEHEIMHRDIKPANIILSYKDRPVLTDFGLARPEKAATLTESGALVGTPIYMSPEQVRGDRAGIDRRTDIYSLGITFYEMLAGVTPFEAESTQEILNKIEYHDPRPLRRVRPDIPRELETICQKAIEKEPSRRYQTAIEFALDLERFLAGDPIQARRASIGTKVIKKVSRHRTISALGLLLAIAVIASLFILQSGKVSQANETQAQYNQLIVEGTKLFRQTDYSAAEATFDHAISLLPENPLGYVERGKNSYQNRKIQTAIADFDRALELDPADARARLWRGISRMRYDDAPDAFEKGVVDLQETLHANPNDRECLLEAARLCLELAGSSVGNSTARQDFLNAANHRINNLLDQNPKDADAIVAQGLLYEEQGLLDQAYLNYQRAVDIDPTNAQAWALKSQGRPEEVEPGAVDEAGDTIQSAAPWWTVLGSQGVNWASKQVDVDDAMLDRALDALSLWDSDTPTEPEPQQPSPEPTVDPPLELDTLLGEADDLWSSGNQTEAVLLYEDLLEANPRLVEPNNRLAEFYMRDGRDPERAQTHIDQALEAAPANLRSLLIALEVYSRLKDRQRLGQVVTTIRRYYPAVESLPGFSTALELLGGQPEEPDPDEKPAGDDGDGI